MSISPATSTADDTSPVRAVCTIPGSGALVVGATGRGPGCCGGGDAGRAASALLVAVLEGEVGVLRLMRNFLALGFVVIQVLRFFQGVKHVQLPIQQNGRRARKFLKGLCLM